MRCNYCGELLSENVKFCTNCGAPVEKKKAPSYGAQPQRPQEEARQVYEATVENSNNYFMADQYPAATPAEAIVAFFTRYADFSGRSRRSEFWWAALFCSIVSSILSNFFSSIAWIWTLATLVPMLALGVRRLHDIGKSGLWYLWQFLPVVGQLILLFQFLKDSEPATNSYGPSTKYR